MRSQMVLQGWVEGHAALDKAHGHTRTSTSADTGDEQRDGGRSRVADKVERWITRFDTRNRGTARSGRWLLPGQASMIHFDVEPLRVSDDASLRRSDIAGFGEELWHGPGIGSHHNVSAPKLIASIVPARRSRGPERCKLVSIAVHR